MANLIINENILFSKYNYRLAFIQDGKNWFLLLGEEEKMLSMTNYITYTLYVITEILYDFWWKY